MKPDRLLSLLSNPELLNHETVFELKQITENYPWFALGWIAYLKNLKQVEAPEYQQTLKKVAVLVPDRKVLYNFLNPDILKRADKTDEIIQVDEFTHSGEETSNSEAGSLIDKFLSNEPTVIRSSYTETSGTKNIQYSVVEKSVAEHDELVTETLAAIYFEQKNFEKAKTAYQKLSLKYPEKSIYFAARIEEIEKIKNINS